MPQTDRTRRWNDLVTRILAEYRQLSTGEKNWIRQRCEQISSLQQRLDRLFSLAAGEEICRDCHGDCCACGHNHPTLVTLLLLLSRGVEMPRLDFQRTCPLLGDKGCLLSADLRPYNCISFVCDRIEDRLSVQQITDFYSLEKELRARYLEIAERFAGGSMRGLLLAGERLQGKPYLRRVDAAEENTGEEDHGTAL